MTRTSFLLLILLPALLLATDAPAQSVKALREENEALQARIRELEAELVAAEARIAQLEAQVESLESAEEEPPPAPPLDAPVTVDESKPEASPRAVLAAIRASFAETFESLDGPSSRSWRKEQRDIEKWIKARERDLRKSIDWQVTVSPNGTVRRGRREARLEFLAVDPVTATPLGSFVAILDRNQLARLGDLEKEHEGLAGITLHMTGTLKPILRINPDRAERGPFDNPPFVGPYVEFGLEVETKTLNNVEDKQLAGEEPATES